MPFTNDMIIDSIANATPPSPSTTRIHRVPDMLIREKDDYSIPKVVSIGPYHFENPELELVEKLKPFYTMKLLSHNKETLRSLYNKLGEPDMVKDLRSFYEENSTTRFCDEIFTKMMLQDSCFILYYIRYIYGGKPEHCGELKSHQVVFVHQDLFLLENQIPFKVLNEVMSLMGTGCFNQNINSFIYGNILASENSKSTWFESMLGIKNRRRRQEPDLELTGDKEPVHLLHLLHRTLTKHEEVRRDIPQNDIYKCTFRNVHELVDVGIRFKRSNTKSLADVQFYKRIFWWSAEVALPPITVDDSTKPMLLNLIAYEMCSCEANDAWVTSYICLLDSLIGDAEDIKILRRAGVLENSLGRGEDIVNLFNEIGNGLVISNLAYSKAKEKMQRHYESWRNTILSELRHEFARDPFAFFAGFGLVSVFLSSVQTYYTVMSPKACDDLCMFLKTNHRL